MRLLTIPEFIIHEALEKALAFIRADYKANIDTPSKSYIYRLLDEAGFQRYRYFEQAIAVFCGEEDDPRLLEVQLMFNVERNGAPSIHITLPSEQSASSGNGLGLDESSNDFYQDEDFQGNLITEDEEVVPIENNPNVNVSLEGSEAKTITPIYTRRYQATYNLVITSDNSNEVVLIFHVLKALVTALTFHFHQNFIQNISIGGQDVNPYDEAGTRLYMRAVTISLQYETSVQSFDSVRLPLDFFTCGGKAING